MQLSPDMRESIKNELGRFAGEMKLSEDQKTQLKSALENARGKIEEYKTTHPNASKEEVIAKLKEARGPLRQRLTAFLTPEQLTKWDAEVTKAKSFLGVAHH